MRNFKIIPHTADIGIKVSADGLQELFFAALLGMNEVIKRGFCQKAIQKSKTQEIKLSSVDTTSLLIDFLNEVLTCSHEKKAVFCRLDFQNLTETTLKATILGEVVDGFDEDIKAVTYHGAKIIHHHGQHQVQILFDI